MYANGRHQNIGNTERLVSGLVGTSLLVYSAICPRKFKIATAVGGIGLVYRGIRGNSKVYDILGIDRNKPRIRIFRSLLSQEPLYIG